MLTATISIPNSDGPDVAAAFGVTTVAEFEAWWKKEVQRVTFEYRQKRGREALPKPAIPNIT